MTPLTRGLGSAALALAIGGGAFATTKAGSNLGTPAPNCLLGTCNTGKAITCSIPADCNAGSLSASSKWTLDGSLLVKGTVKGVLDPAGMPVTTDGTVGTPDDYIFQLCVRAYINGSIDACIYVHVELNKGSGKIALAASPLATLFDPGTAVEIREVKLFAPPANPAMCPGDNDTGNPGTFVANQVGLPTKPACETGGAVGVGGIVNGS